jgi:hypothetical protein
MGEHYTEEGVGFVDATREDAVEEARKRHHLASADPEPERDGTMTGPAHEAKYGLEREKESAAAWRAAGVHPYENGALREEDVPENADAPKANEKAVPPSTNA